MMNNLFHRVLPLIGAALVLVLTSCSVLSGSHNASSVDKYINKSAIITQADPVDVSTFRQTIDGASIADMTMKVATNDQVEAKLKELSSQTNYVKVTPKECLEPTHATMLKGLDATKLDSFVVTSTQGDSTGASVIYHASEDNVIDDVVAAYNLQQEKCAKVTMKFPKITVEQRTKVQQLPDYEKNGLVTYLTTAEQVTTLNKKTESDTMSTLQLIYPTGQSLLFSGTSDEKVKKMAEDTLLLLSKAGKK